MKNNKSVEKKVYTVDEAKKLLNLCKGTVYSLIRSGAIPSIKIGGQYRIPKGRLDKWFNENKEGDSFE